MQDAFTRNIVMTLCDNIFYVVNQMSQPDLEVIRQVAKERRAKRQNQHVVPMTIVHNLINVKNVDDLIKAWDVSFTKIMKIIMLLLLLLLVNMTVCFYLQK